MKTILKTFAAALLTFATLGTHSAWAAWDFHDIDWVGGGDNTLASTTANWHGNKIPPNNNGMRFCSGAYDKIVTFDSVYNVTYVFSAEADENYRFYNPATGEVHPVVWKATDPAYGITITGTHTSNNAIKIAEWDGQYAALRIKSGTYKTGAQWWLAGNNGGAAWMCLEGGTVNPGGHFVMANASGSIARMTVEGGTVNPGGELIMAPAGSAEALLEIKGGTVSPVGDLNMANANGSRARLIVGSGDPTKIATFTVPIDKWAIMSKNAGGDGQITLKAGGEFHCAYIASWSANGILRFDGGTLVKDGDVSNQIGLIYGTEVEERKTPGHDDSSRKLEVTANGGTIDVKTIPTTLRSTVYLAEGAEDGVLTKLGSATLTLANAASGFGGTFRAAEGTLALGTVGESTKAILDGGSVTIGGGTLAKLTLGGGFSASVAGLPAHTALAIKGGAELKIDDLTSSPLADETTATFDADVSAQNPITINLLELADVDLSEAYPIVGGLNLEDGEVDLVILKGFAEGGSCFVEDGKLMLKLADNVVASAFWTNALGDNDPMKPGNWTCYNAAGDVIPDVLPGKTVTLALNTDGTWASWPEFFTADSTIDLKGHKLTVPTLDKGKIIDSTGTGYRLLDYIESNGSQYIDTGVIGTPTTRLTMDATLVRRNNVGKYDGWFGSQVQNPNTMSYLSFDVYFNGNGKFASALNDGADGDWIAGSVAPADGTRYQLDLDATTKRFMLGVNGGAMAQQGNHTKAVTLNTWGTLLLFVQRHNGEPYLERRAHLKLHSTQIYENGALIRSFVPAQRISDSKVGLLDLEHLGEKATADEPEFYTGISTGEDFTPGEVTDAQFYTGTTGELHVNVQSAEPTIVNSAVTISGDIPLVKDGEGTLIWGGGTLTAATPIVITDGVFKMGVTTENVFGNGGTITVKDGGQFDINYGVANKASPVFNKTFKIEGAGPDGTGAIVNTVENGAYGYHLSFVTLTGDATIGGRSNIDFRGDFGVTGPDYVLTIKNTRYVAFCAGRAYVRVKRVVCDGGGFQPCANITFDEIAEGVFLKNGGILTPWSNVANYDLPFAVTVEAGEKGVVRCDNNTSKFSGPLTVESGAMLTVISASKACSFAGAVVNDGTITSEGPKVDITGTLSGSGAITGANLAFSGDNACWHVDISGKTTVQKVNLEAAPATFLAGLKRVEITSDKAAGYYDLAPLKGLVSLDGVTLEVTEKTTERERKACSLQIRDDRLGVRIPSGLMLIFQ